MFTKKHEINVISTTMNGGLGDRWDPSANAVTEFEKTKMSLSIEC